MRVVYQFAENYRNGTVIPSEVEESVFVPKSNFSNRFLNFTSGEHIAWSRSFGSVPFGMTPWFMSWVIAATTICHPSVAAAASRALSEVEGVVEGSVQAAFIQKNRTDHSISSK